MIKRLCQISSRYGWRTPVVMAALLLVRWNLAVIWRGGLLVLLTRGKKGRGIKLGRGISVNPGALLEIGDNLIWEGPSTVRVNTSGNAIIGIGNNVWISQGLQLYACNSILIGNEVMIGESVSMRDSTHSVGRLDMPMQSQGDVYGSIRIEDDVWIGRGVFIQGKPAGTVIGRGAIVGANSVVVKSIPAMEIWGGVPAKFIRRRNSAFGPGGN